MVGQHVHMQNYALASLGLEANKLLCTSEPVAGVPKAPGAPAVALVDPTVRVTFNKADTTAVKYSAFVKDSAGEELEVPLAVKPVTGSTTQLFALVAPDPPELPQGSTYTLQVGCC